MRLTHSDSVSPGSNPGSPATQNPTFPGFLTARHAGHARLDRRTVPHEIGHSLFPARSDVTTAAFHRILDEQMRRQRLCPAEPMPDLTLAAVWGEIRRRQCNPFIMPEPLSEEMKAAIAKARRDMAAVKVSAKRFKLASSLPARSASRRAGA